MRILGRGLIPAIPSDGTSRIGLLAVFVSPQSALALPNSPRHALVGGFREPWMA